MSDDDATSEAWESESFRKYATLKEHYVENAHDINFPGTFHGFDDSLNLDQFKNDLNIKITRLEGLECEFDISGVHPSLANAFRRILLAEVPSMAIEKVFIKNNTSIIQDEVLAHRLGLIPIRADPRQFEFPQVPNPDDKNGPDPLEARPKEHLVFKLKIRCKKNPQAPPKSTDPDELYLDHKVYSKDLQWKPVGDQAEWLTGEAMPRVVEENILIAKMRPGHEIDLKAHCVKGVGRDHAKFSPVATATYRMLPEIHLLQEVRGSLADRLAACFSEGVIEVKGHDEDRIAKVVNARLDTGSREVFRHDDLRDLVQVVKRKDFFLFSIESTGALPPDTLMEESIKIMMNKCQTMLQAVKQAQKEAQQGGPKPSSGGHRGGGRGGRGRRGGKVH